MNNSNAATGREKGRTGLSLSVMMSRGWGIFGSGQIKMDAQIGSLSFGIPVLV